MITTNDRRPLHRLELEAIGVDLIRRLGGTWAHDQGMCRCPLHSDREPSLSVRMGATNLLFHCFAGCDTRQILRWVHRTVPQGLSASVPATVKPRDMSDWLRKRANTLWQDAMPIHGTPAERYLQARAIPAGSNALRFHARTPLGRGRQAVRRPALLARVDDQNGLVAVQRTFLDPNLTRRARDLGNPRRLLGQPGQGAVQLFEASDVLGLAEGVETAMSAAILLQIPVWAVLGNERLQRIAVPDSVTRLILLPDNDRAGRRCADAALAAHARPGREIETVFAWRGLNDWNDVLRLAACTANRSR